jgi:UDP-N-acetylmuramoylalanine--D-glutamate ligase
MAEGLHVIVGLGVTALSCARFLNEHNIPFAFADTRTNPPHLERLTGMYPGRQVSLGALDDNLLNSAAKIIVSPGVSIKEPALARQIAQGKTVVGDIELFAHAVNAPVIAITGTNAKSTVTTLVGKMALAAGLRSQMGGNLGIPALDLITQDNPELYVLELSSFQLETTHSLRPKVAALLNITPDHMDRYATLNDYTDAKHRVFNHCEIAVCNRDDAATDTKSNFSKEKIKFTLQIPGEKEFGLMPHQGGSYLAFEDKLLMPARELPILGRHYQANALAALAIGHSFGLLMEPMMETLIGFNGLEHRCQLVRESNGVRWYNDSKGTNVGATLAAIEGLGPEIDGKLILIAGGVGKNADFSPLVPGIAKYVRTVILIGEAAPVLADVLTDRVEICFAKSMQEAVALAAQVATPGDSVLLSPACASFDMFNNFEHRGEVFTEVVKGLT